jgi:glycine/serine hydroxymethyltransferase
LIDRVLRSGGDEAALKAVRQDVLALCRQFPLPH